jgi:glutathione S-transferase
MAMCGVGIERDPALSVRRPCAALWPADPAARAMGDQWMDWQFLYADAQRDAFLGCVRGGKDGSDPVVAKSAAACATLMAMLDAQLARQPWLGRRFGVADIPMGTYAHTWFSLPIERPRCPMWRPGWSGCAPGPASRNCRGAVHMSWTPNSTPRFRPDRAGGAGSHRAALSPTGRQRRDRQGRR